MGSDEAMEAWLNAHPGKVDSLAELRKLIAAVRAEAVADERRRITELLDRGASLRAAIVDESAEPLDERSFVPVATPPAPPDGHVALTWDELYPYEQQQGGYWLYPVGAGVHGEGKVFVRVATPEPVKSAGQLEHERLTAAGLHHAWYGQLCNVPGCTEDFCIGAQEAATPPAEPAQPATCIHGKTRAHRRRLSPSEFLDCPGLPVPEPNKSK